MSRDKDDDVERDRCINAFCPWSGEPVQAGSLTLYRGRVVGFCNPGCRDKFETACNLFDGLIGDAPEQEPGTPSTSSG